MVEGTLSAVTEDSAVVVTDEQKFIFPRSAVHSIELPQIDARNVDKAVRLHIPYKQVRILSRTPVPKVTSRARARPRPKPVSEDDDGG